MFTPGPVPFWGNPKGKPRLVLHHSGVSVGVQGKAWRDANGKGKGAGGGGKGKGKGTAKGKGGATPAKGKGLATPAKGKGLATIGKGKGGANGGSCLRRDPLSISCD